MMERDLNPVDVAMGRVLRLHRVAAGFSQAQVGQAVGITFQQIQKYEAGTNRLSVSRLFQLCDVLGLEPSEVMAEVQEQTAAADGGEPTPARARLEFLSSKSGHRAVEAMMDLRDPALMEACANFLSAVRGKLENGAPKR